MGLLDDILNVTPNGQDMGLLSYLQPNAPASDSTSKKTATADELASALGLTSTGQDAFNPATYAPSASPPQDTPSFADRYAPALNLPPMQQASAAPQFGANATPYVFPQSSALFGANPPSPTAPAATPAQAPVVAADDDDDTPVAASPAQASPIGVGNYQMPRIGSAAAFTSPAAAPATAPAQAPVTAPAPDTTPSLGDHLKASWQSMRNGGGLIGGLSAAITGQRDDPGATLQAQQAAQSNVTAKALLARGIDPNVVAVAIQPGNKEILESVVKQAFGPPQAAPQYAWNPKTQKVDRLYTPDDKTPSGFTQADDGTMHFTPGGPADPAYQRLLDAQKKDPNGVHVLGKGGELYKVDDKGNATVVHKNEDNVDASLSDDTAKMMAQQYLSGDRTVLQNVGRGAQGSANLIKIRSAIKDEADKQGLDGNGIAQRMIDYVGDTARERTAATQEGRMSPAGIEAHGAIQLGRVASDAVPRGNWVPVNKVIQAYEEGTSDPALRAFGSANTTIINTYARAINPNGVGTVADKEHARQMLSTADGPKAYGAVLDQLDKEIEMAHASPSQARAGFKQERDSRLNGQAPPTAIPDAPIATGPKDGDIAHNPTTRATIVRKDGKWVPAQ